jgi:aspartate racemase
MHTDSRQDGGRLTTTRHIGIAAVSPEGAALCYRQLFRHASRLFPGKLPPRVTIHNEPLQTYIEYVRADDWEGVSKLLLKSVDVLKKAGVDFVLTPDNAVQHGVMIAEHQSPIPWLTMPDLVADALLKNKHQTVGILGTRYVTQGSAYQTALGLKGIKLQVPSDEDAAELDRIVFQELIHGTTKDLSKQAVLDISNSFQARGSEAIVIAASELGLVLEQISPPLPMFDAAELLAIGAVHRALAL